VGVVRKKTLQLFFRPPRPKLRPTGRTVSRKVQVESKKRLRISLLGGTKRNTWVKSRKAEKEIRGP